MELTREEISELTLQIKEVINNFKPNYSAPVITYKCDGEKSAINYPVISVITENRRVAIINIYIN